MTTVRACALLLLPVCLSAGHFDWLPWRDRSAQARPAAKSKPPIDGILGVVVRKNPHSFVVRTVDTRFVTFQIADTTLYFHGSRWASATRLQRGAVVAVENSADRNGNLTATAVVFQDKRPEMQTWTPASELLPGGMPQDPLIERAREASGRFFNSLPNFVCQQSTARAVSTVKDRWRTVDQITAEVVYDHGHEAYRDVKLNGRPTGRSMMDLPGSRSTGEFGSTLRALFAPQTEALFQFESNQTLRGFSAALYKFAVSGDLSDWRISAGSQTIITPYTGRIWIDRASGNVVRMEMQAARIPRSFPFQRVEAEVDYGPAMLQSGRYFLPERAQNLSCNDPQMCSRNLIEFRNYHKYTGESSITYQPLRDDRDTVPNAPRE
jgi:hypothetical protein